MTVLPPLSLMPHRATIARPTLTGTGTTTATVGAAVPCLATVDTRTVMLPEGPLVRNVTRVRFRPNVDIQRGDLLTVAGQSGIQVQEVTPHVGPNGQPAYVETAAW